MGCSQSGLDELRLYETAWLPLVAACTFELFPFIDGDNPGDSAASINVSGGKRQYGLLPSGFTRKGCEFQGSFADTGEANSEDTYEFLECLPRDYRADRLPKLMRCRFSKQIRKKHEKLFGMEMERMAFPSQVKTWRGFAANG